MIRRHTMPFGAEVGADGSVRFRLWAPNAKKVELRLNRKDGDDVLGMDQGNDGWFQLTSHSVEPGNHYTFRIDGNVNVPDPASRFQPRDVHGPSEIIEPASFDWEDEDWYGRPWEEAVIYEIHVGTFTPHGTFAALEGKLDYLVDVGITAIELMPVADFPGARNWGYDGVCHFAPDSGYGRPDELKRLVQSAHQKGLMVFLDVVYNHFGPEGNYLRAYAPQFFTSQFHTPWGDAINFSGAGSRVVRDFFINNALYWLTEFHFDGLRLDAVHAIFDESLPDILTELAQAVRNRIGSHRHVHLVLENDDNAAHYQERKCGQPPRFYNAQWNDDIHHVLHVILTGEKDGYYADYADEPVRRLGRCLAEGFDYQGQPSEFRGGKPRGEPSRELPPTAFVSFMQNHDQVGNRAFGERIVKLADPESLKAALAVLLLAPSPPLLFMGEEFGAESPFLFFCDFGPDLAAAVTEGRRKEFARFARFQDPSERARIPDPAAESTFLQSKLNWSTSDDAQHQSWREFYRSLLNIRRRSIVPLARCIQPGKTTSKTLGRSGLLMSWKMNQKGELNLAVNLGIEHLTDVSRPRGELLYTTTDNVVRLLAEGQMPPWSVAWFIEQ